MTANHWIKAGTQVLVTRPFRIGEAHNTQVIRSGSRGRVVGLIGTGLRNIEVLTEDGFVRVAETEVTRPNAVFTGPLS